MVCHRNNLTVQLQWARHGGLKRRPKTGGFAVLSVTGGDVKPFRRRTTRGAQGKLEQLQEWTATVADVRVHGTKRSGRWTASRRSVTRWCRRRRGRAFRPEAPLTRVVAADYLVGLLAGRGEMERNTDRDVSNKNKHTSIADNPSVKKVSDYLLLARIVRLTTGFSKTLGITNATVDRLHHSADKALRQSDILTLPDRFNAAFASEGWIATGSPPASARSHFGGRRLPLL